MHVRGELNYRMIEIAQREMNKRGWTQYQLGKHMGLSPPEISKLMNYKRQWTFTLVERFKAIAKEDVRVFRA